MGLYTPLHWLIVLVIFVLLARGRKIAEIIENLGSGRPRRPGGPQHPIPVTGPVETKKAEKNSSDQEEPGPLQKVA